MSMISINRAALLVNAHPLRRRAQRRYQRVPAVRLPRSPATPWGYDCEGVVMKVALIQMNSQDDKAANLKAVEALVDAAVADARPDLVALPEMFPYLAMDDDGRRRAAETVPDGEALALLGDLAVRHGTTIHGGSILEADGNRMFNTTFVVDPEGRRIARYRKIHMFDVTTPDGMEYWESETFSRGEEVVSYAIDGITVGCSVCYDLRFPELYQALAKKGASVIVVPAAFTMQTGKDHWETLLRARAIETQCYGAGARAMGAVRERHAHELGPLHGRRPVGAYRRPVPRQGRVRDRDPRFRLPGIGPRRHSGRRPQDPVTSDASAAAQGDSSADPVMGFVDPEWILVDEHLGVRIGGRHPFHDLGGDGVGGIQRNLAVHFEVELNKELGS